MPSTTQVTDFLDALLQKWPNVFTPEFCKRVIGMVSNLPYKQQILKAQTLALDFASVQCGTCTDCSLSNNRLCFPVWADGIPSAKVFVIGEGPGQYEQRTGTPFTWSPELSNSFCKILCTNFKTCYPIESLRDGKGLPDVTRVRKATTDQDERSMRASQKVGPLRTAASLLDKAIEGLFARESWNASKAILGQVKTYSNLYITNLVRCRSTDKDGKDKEPNKEYMNACWKWLEMQLMIAQPEVVILLGAPATRYMLDAPQLKFLKKEGDKFKSTGVDGAFAERKPGSYPRLPKSVKYIGTAFHPSYIRRQYDEGEIMGEDAFRGIRSVFEKAAAVIGDENGK